MTADNASNNNTMIDHLSTKLEDFPGASNQTRCFLHILNITAKVIIKQFDIPKAKNGVTMDDMDDAAQALASLAEGLDAVARDAYEAQECQDDEAEDLPLDRWIDYQAGLTEEERKKIALGIRPVQTMLTKVCVMLLSQQIVELTLE